MSEYMEHFCKLQEANYLVITRKVDYDCSYKEDCFCFKEYIYAKRCYDYYNEHKNVFNIHHLRLMEVKDVED